MGYVSPETHFCMGLKEKEISMKVHSLIRKGFGFGIVEVEVSLAPGLPTMQVIGLPDTMIKESIFRIRAALNHQSFLMPVSQQILVNLKPAHIKKTSQGLDLAIAAALLWETEQIPLPKDSRIPLLYGELSLTGLVGAPEDLEDYISENESRPIFTGMSRNSFEFEVLEIRELKDLVNILNSPREKLPVLPIRPALSKFKLGRNLARLTAVVAAGEHATLFAGPPGSGKTTAAENISNLIKEPELPLFQISRQISKRFGIPISWRPHVAPHHTMPALSLVGGGGRPNPGEITRAHGGVLLLDEYLEFDSQIQEALREPMDSGQITISRGSAASVFPCQFLLLATTNLCKCGQYVPKVGHRCTCQEKRRRNYIDRFSGPVMDRFSILAFSDTWKDESREMMASDILVAIKKAQNFALKVRGQRGCNSQIKVSDIECTLAKSANPEQISGMETSERRKSHLLRVARTLADLDQKHEISINHLRESAGFTLTPMKQLRESPFARVYKDITPIKRLTEV